MKPATFAVPVLLLSLLFSGCMIGPKWQQEVSLNVPPGAVAGKKIVVSGFLKSVSATSTTGSARITEIKESVQVSDVSGVIAARLQEKGLASEARRDFKAAFLHRDEVLLSGAIITQERKVNWVKAIPASIFSALTLFLLPTPIPFEEGRLLVYRVELTDPQGRILYQTGDQEIVGLAEGIIRKDNLRQYTARGFADPSSGQIDFDRAKPYLVRAYRIRVRELGRDDAHTIKLEQFIRDAFGTDLLNAAQGR